MKPEIYDRKGFYHALTASILIMFVALVTRFRKDLFVDETGNIQIFGLIGTVFAIGLIMRWPKARQILIFLSSIHLLILVFITFIGERKFIVSYLALSCVVASILLLLCSSYVRDFTNARQGR